MSSLFDTLRANFSHLPQEDILDSQNSALRYENNAVGLEVSLAATIKLSKHDDIKTLIELAISEKFIIQTVSSGNNWGYGNLWPEEGREIVLLDLAKMNQIKVIDKDLGLISVQPGVTQQQLYTYLEENGWPYMTPVTGAGPTCSILANAIERGYGITPHTDHFHAVTKLTVIVPNPDVWPVAEDGKVEYLYESGVASLDLTEEKFIDHTLKWGLGSYLEGLWTQSSMGIVTEATIRLAHKPEAFVSFYIKINTPDKLPETIEFIKDTLRDYEGIVGSINLMDRRRVLSMVADNPNGPGAHQVMTDEQIATLSKKNDVSEWMIAGSIYGKKQVVSAVKSLIRRSAKFSDQTIFSDGLLIKAGKLASTLFPFGFLKAAGEQLQALDEGIDIMLGKPQQVALPLAYWRNPRVKPDKSRMMNPDKDECGLLWYAPLIPMNVTKIQEFIDFIRATAPKYNIEPLITFTNLKHDCIDSTIPIIFDVKNPDAKKDAYDCLEELFEEGRKRGYIPYRMSTQHQMTKLDPNKIHWRLVKEVKDTLDPHNVLAPNRYNPANQVK